MAEIRKPSITFLLPYRMLTEDRDFLGQNLITKIRAYVGEGDDLMLKKITAYSVALAQQGYKPVDVRMSARELTKLLKPVFPNGKCIDCESYFVQTRSKTMLPIIDVQIYF